MSTVPKSTTLTIYPYLDAVLHSVPYANRIFLVCAMVTFSRLCTNNGYVDVTCVLTLFQIISDPSVNNG